MISDCKLISFPKIEDARGNLTFIEHPRNLPFDIQRVYYLYDVPGGAARAGHGHLNLEQVIIAVAGSFSVEVDDGVSKETYTLNRSYIGLYLPKMTWRDITNFSSGAVCLVLASDVYDESDYLRNYSDFVRATKVRK
jgi:hypothetical protein